MLKRLLQFIPEITIESDDVEEKIKEVKHRFSEDTIFIESSNPEEILRSAFKSPNT